MPAPASDATPLRVGFREFVTFVACCMAINAIGIDVILPALPAMGDALGIVRENSRQFIITAYMLGFGVMQIVYGPLADRYGRRPIIIASLAMFAVTSLLATFATDFTTIITARTLQGMAAAAMRVLAISIVRDRYHGRQMARVMSLTFVVFLAVPILAPTIGQLILYIAPWPVIFYFLAVYAVLLAIWTLARIPETLHPEDRRPINIQRLREGAYNVLTTRSSIGYTLAGTLMFGSLMGFINSVQQIFADTFGRPDIMVYIFGGIASGMGIAAYSNSRVVERLGTRFVSHWALIGFVTVAVVHSIWAVSGMETMWTFAGFQAATMICFALAGSNFNALAMEPMGHMAGTAASIQGTISSVGGALLGLVIGQSFDGSTVPVAIGYLLLGTGSLLVVLVVERGRLFAAHRAEPQPS